MPIVTAEWPIEDNGPSRPRVEWSIFGDHVRKVDIESAAGLCRERARPSFRVATRRPSRERSNSGTTRTMNGFLSALARQFVNDLKASRVKSATLGVLVVIGLALWIPPLVRLTAGLLKADAPPASPSRPGPNSGRRHPAAGRSPKSPAETGAPGTTWQDADRLLSAHPLLRSADAGSVAKDPFRMDLGQFPPPILFAEEPASTKSTGEGEPEPASPSESLTLKSTIVGGARRAALINERLYDEGDEFEIDGTTYRLKSVFRRKVLLSDGMREIELNLHEGSSSDSIQLRRIVTDDERAP